MLCQIFNNHLKFKLKNKMTYDPFFNDENGPLVFGTRNNYHPILLEIFSIFERHILRIEQL